MRIIMMPAFSIEEIDAFVKDASQATLKRVLEWIERGAPLDAPNAGGVTALFAAAERNNINVIRSLLKAGASANKLSRTIDCSREGGSPLSAACERGDHPAIKVLLTKGADPRVLNGRFETAAHCLLRAWASTIKDQADGEKLILQSLDRLIVAGVPLDQLTKAGTSLLSIAVAQDMPTSVLSLLLDKGADPNRRLHGGCTVAHEAARWGNAPALRVLAAGTADTNAVDDCGRTPLFLASGYEVCSQLLGLGCDPNHVEVRGMGVLAYFVSEHRTTATTLLRASVPVQIPALLDAGADPTHKDYSGRTAINIAREGGLTGIEAFISARFAREAMKEMVPSPQSTPV
jgi:ankyrin repeat protein